VTLQNQYGAGSGVIWLDDVECIGYESSIAECRHNSWGYHNCRHSEDVSISCESIDDCEFFSGLNNQQYNALAFSLIIWNLVGFRFYCMIDFTVLL